MSAALQQRLGFGAKVIIGGARRRLCAFKRRHSVRFSDGDFIVCYAVLCVAGMLNQPAG